jgi:hypothetical protein
MSRLVICVCPCNVGVCVCVCYVIEVPITDIFDPNCEEQDHHYKTKEINDEIEH